MRPTQNEYFMNMAVLAATRGTCARRQVGCVLVNARNHVLATGYNGVPSGWAHCIDDDTRCPGAEYDSTKGLDKCQAIHAEQNALLQCRDVYEIKAAYCTTSPCIHCVKLLLNTSCHVIVYGEKYDSHALQMWANAKRIVVQHHWHR